jgi:hypothetical protein
MSWQLRTKLVIATYFFLLLPASCSYGLRARESPSQIPWRCLHPAMFLMLRGGGAHDSYRDFVEPPPGPTKLQFAHHNSSELIGKSGSSTAVFRKLVMHVLVAQARPAHNQWQIGTRVTVCGPMRSMLKTFLCELQCHGVHTYITHTRARIHTHTLSLSLLRI